MSCGPQPTTFRILDANSYWSVDAQRIRPIDRLTIGDRIELARSGGIAEADIVRRIPPRWLARGCGPCEWWLASKCSPGLLRAVGSQWIHATQCAHRFVCPSAVAVAGHRLAVLDPGSGEVLVYVGNGQRLALQIPLTASGPIALDRDGTLYVVDGAHIRRFDLSGNELARWDAPRGIDRIAVSEQTKPDCTQQTVVWLIATGARGATLYRRDQDRFVEATLAELEVAFPLIDLVAASDAGFCLELPAGGDARVRTCFDRCGCPLTDGSIPPPAPTKHESEGSLIFGLIDSGIPRCIWHRLRIEADLPARTSIEVSVVAVETSTDHPDDADWQVIESGSLDFLIDQPPGRYLNVKLVLRGDGTATPSIRRVRVDFPRSTSAEWLPGVYRDDPAGSAFLDRFVSLFDAAIEDIDRVITRFPALLDSASVPNEVLGWLASLIGVALDPSIAPGRRRDLIAAAPELFRKRGTPAGLHDVLAKAFGVDAAIEELGATTPFQRIGTATLGGTRLFGRGKTRATLGMSKLGSTQIHAFGDPQQDARGLLAFRVRVQVPPSADLVGAQGRERLMRIVEANKPAHVVADVRLGGGTAILGSHLAIGIDTTLTGLEPSLLGRTTRLSRQTVLAPGAHRAGATISIGRDAVVGANMTLR